MRRATSLLSALVFVLSVSPAPLRAQRLTDADRAAELVVRWQRIVYPQFEEARAYLAEEVSDMVNALLSQGAVRAVHDRVDAPGLKKSDDAVQRFAAAMLKAGTRQPGGSLILEPSAYEQALDAVCPLYPFCEH
jgi:hypothetical protein